MQKPWRFDSSLLFCSSRSSHLWVETSPELIIYRIFRGFIRLRRIKTWVWPVCVRIRTGRRRPPRRSLGAGKNWAKGGVFQRFRINHARPWRPYSESNLSCQSILVRNDSIFIGKKCLPQRRRGAKKSFTHWQEKTNCPCGSVANYHFLGHLWPIHRKSIDKSYHY